jgi:hypothetical protein
VTARALAWCVSTYMDADGRAVVAYATLATKLEVNARTIRRCAQELEAAGLVRVRVGIGRASTRWYAQLRGDTRVPSAELLDGYWQAKLDTYGPSEGTPMSPVLEVQRSTRPSARRAR